MSDKQTLFNNYRDAQAQIEYRDNLAKQIETSKQALGLTLGEQTLSRLTKRIFPEKAKKIADWEILNNQAGNLHLDLRERDMKKAQIGLKLPWLFTRTPAEVRTIEQILSNIDQLIPDILTQIKLIQGLLEKTKTKIKQSAVVEVADLVVETHLFPGRQLASSLIDALSTWMSSVGLNTDEINTNINALSLFQEKLTSLQNQLTQLTGAQNNHKNTSTTLSPLPNFTIVEYADLLSDIFHKGKDFGSIASLLAQGVTYQKVVKISQELTSLAEQLQELPTKNDHLRKEITEYRQFDSAYTPPHIP